MKKTWSYNYHQMTTPRYKQASTEEALKASIQEHSEKAIRSLKTYTQYSNLSPEDFEYLTRDIKHEIYVAMHDAWMLGVKEYSSPSTVEPSAPDGVWEEQSFQDGLR